MRILVVDDEPLVAKTLSLVFQKHGFDVTTVFTADAALASALAESPDLVLCDIQMPGRDGIALMDDLGRALPACPILVLTGVVENATRIMDCATTHHQNVRILSKPCPPLELLREADSLLHLQV